VRRPRGNVSDLAAKGVQIAGEPTRERWGLVTSIPLPSGAELGLYQPTHATAYQLSQR
jgi:hypothetical protein